MSVPQEVIDSFARVYLTIQDCPDGPEAGRAAAIALMEAEDERRGTSHAAAIVRLLDRVDAELRGAS